MVLFVDIVKLLATKKSSMISLQVMCFTHEEVKRLLTKFVIIKNAYYERAKSCVFTCEDVKRLPTKL